jgi:hypothetical protein
VARQWRAERWLLGETRRRFADLPMGRNGHGIMDRIAGI